MLEYRELDSGRNEVRLITTLGLTGQGDPLFPPDLVKCDLEHVSLNDHTPEYAKFLELDGLHRSTLPRAILWEYITGGEEVEALKLLMAQQQQQQQQQQHGNRAGGVVPETVRTFVDKPVYHERGKYNKNTTRWTWGEFDALSYVWGDPTVRSDIIVNKQRVSVTKNLEEALRNLHYRRGRHQNGNRIWVDALCINQNNIEERNKQVKRMKHIYADAENVYVWTGPELTGGEHVERFINDVGSAILRSPETFRWYIPSIPGLYHDSAWKGIMELMSRPYWGRLWIIQEVLLANTATKLCFGNRICSLPAWFATFAVLRGDLSSFFFAKARAIFATEPNASVLGDPTSFITSGTNMERLIELDQFKYADLPGPDLMLLLDAGRSAHQWDTKDKVYALLGLMDPAIQHGVDPDYSAPVFKTYRDFCWSVIKATGKLKIIFQGAASTIRNEHYPSWVPDWSLTLKDSFPFQYSPHLRAAKDFKHVYESDNNENHLVCRGFRVDVIDGLGCNAGVEPHVRHHVVPSGFNNYSPNIYKDDEGVNNALWETFTLGNMTNVSSAIATLLKSIPWFNGVAASRDIPFYKAIDRFQQCNQGLTIAGKSLAQYFPRWSEVFNMPPAVQDIYSALSMLMLPLNFRRLMIGKKGYVGFVPKMSQANDLIFVLMGCDIPLVLRPCKNDLYQLVGECYVHGIMNGEAMEGLDYREYELETVTLC
jgi:hypothetical protein